MKKIMVNVSIKTLGVYLNPIIEWKDQHEDVKSKIQVTIRRLMRIEMKSCQAHMHFNTHVLTNVFLVVA